MLKFLRRYPLHGAVIALVVVAVGASAAVLTTRGSTLSAQDIASCGYGGAACATTDVGYRLVGRDGLIERRGSLPPAGDALDRSSYPITGAAPTLTNNGDWLVNSAGTVYDIGAAPDYGDAAGYHYPSAVVGITATPDGGGYWLFTAKGRVAGRFGDSVVTGQTLGYHIPSPIVALAAGPTDSSYWVISSRGRVVPFGGVRFYGDPLQRGISTPVVAMVGTPSGDGYYTLTAPGRVMAFGDAHYRGEPLFSPAAKGLTFVAMLVTPDNGGYGLVASNGDIFAYGNFTLYKPYIFTAFAAYHTPVVAAIG